MECNINEALAQGLPLRRPARLGLPDALEIRHTALEQVFFGAPQMAERTAPALYSEVDQQCVGKRELGDAGSQRSLKILHFTRRRVEADIRGLG